MIRIEHINLNFFNLHGLLGVYSCGFGFYMMFDIFSRRILFSRSISVYRSVYWITSLIFRKKEFIWIWKRLLYWYASIQILNHSFLNIYDLYLRSMSASFFPFLSATFPRPKGTDWYCSLIDDFTLLNFLLWISFSYYFHLLSRYFDGHGASARPFINYRIIFN